MKNGRQRNGSSDAIFSKQVTSAINGLHKGIKDVQMGTCYVVKVDGRRLLGQYSYSTHYFHWNNWLLLCFRYLGSRNMQVSLEGTGRA